MTVNGVITRFVFVLKAPLNSKASAFLDPGRDLETDHKITVTVNGKTGDHKEIQVAKLRLVEVGQGFGDLNVLRRQRGSYACRRSSPDCGSRRHRGLGRRWGIGSNSYDGHRCILGKAVAVEGHLQKPSLGFLGVDSMCDI